MGDDASGNPSTHRHTYVIDRDHRVVYMDQAAHRAFPRGQVGSICYEAFRGASEPCDDCPWHGHESNSGDATQTVIFSARRDRWYEITCLEVDWFDRGPCVLFSGRPVDDRSRSLFSTLREPSSYDELFEINVTGDTYKVLYHEPGKYAMPPLSGELGAMFDDVLRNMINPEDRERFQRFWDFDTLLERIEEEDGALRGEFRKLRCNGSWGWVAQTVVPVKRGEGGETVVMCFIADIDAEVRAREEHAENAQIRQLRERDQLTGIYNAATFYAKASALLEAHPERCHEAIYLDIEHFKLFNEWHGREAGDEMLRAIANRLSNLAERYEGVAGYLGGDDFALVLPHGTITEDAVDLHERQRYIFRQVHPDDRGLVMSLFEQAEQHPVSGSEGTIRRYRLCGDLMWLHMKVFFLRREQDRSIFFASLSDVTGQKEQELELRSSQTALNDVLGLPSAERALDDMSSENRQVAAQIFLENVPGGLIGGYCEEGFPILFANEEIARMAGYDTSAELIEALDGKVGNSIHPDDLPHVMEDIGPDYYEGLDYTTQYRMPRKDGSWFWVADHGRVVRTKNGRLAIASVCLDIDDSVRMQQELALDDEMLHRIILQASLNVWIYDVEHDRLTFQNLSSDGLAALLASADRFAPEQGAATADRAGRMLRRLAREALHDGVPVREIEALAEDGDPTRLRVTCEAVPDGTGRPVRVIGYIENVAQSGPDTESDLFEMLKGRAVDHWCVNLRTHSFLDASDRRAWRRAVGAVLEDWTDTTPAERIGRTVRTVKDAEAVKSFLDFDAMLARFEDGVLFDSLEYRQEDERGERWMELGYRLIRIEAGGDVYAYLSVTDIDRRKRRELDLEDKARHDALTGLLNRQTGAALLPEALAKTLRKGTAGAFVIIDLDDFKLVNDRHGHLSGDTALADVGRHLRSAFRKNDLVCRWGGDEFIVYCDDITRASLARRVGTLCGKPWTTKVRGGTTIEVSASAGVVLVPKQGTEFKTVYDRADAALYRAKSMGKAHFCFYEPGIPSPLAD